MRLLKAIAIPSLCLTLAACAANKTTHPNDYVEIDNPYITMSPNAPATIWVPRSYVESGVPRGGELVKKGVEKISENFQPPQQAQAGAPAPQPPAAAAVPQPAALPQQPKAVAAAPLPPVAKAPAAAEAPPAVKNCIALLEMGQNGLAQPLYDNLRRAAAGVLVDPAQAAFLSQFATITTPAEKGAFARRLQQDYHANVAVYLAAPDGVAPGKMVSAEIYDALGGGLLRRFDAVIPSYAASDKAARDSAVAAVLAGFATQIKELVVLLPWYGRITEVDGNRAYVAAGREAGLAVGQVLKIYRSGKYVEGLGYAPGEKIGTLVVGGFVGPNGSFGSISTGHGVQAADVVSVE